MRAKTLEQIPGTGMQGEDSLSLVFWNGRQRELSADRIAFPKGFNRL